MEDQRKWIAVDATRTSKNGHAGRRAAEGIALKRRAIGTWLKQGDLLGDKEWASLEIKSVQARGHQEVETGTVGAALWTQTMCR